MRCCEKVIPMKLLVHSIVLVVVAAGNLIAEDLTHAKFLDLHKALRPSPDEPWRTIPWKTSLIDAQHTAAESRKPIFIWAMDGHPLGCT